MKASSVRAIKSGDCNAIYSFTGLEPAILDYTDDKGMTLLHLAVWKSQNIDIVKHLVQNGPDINVKSKAGYTPLHYAAKFNTPKVIHFLIQSGADLEIRDNSGKCPVDYANENNRTIFEKLKKDSNANENSRASKNSLFGWMTGFFKRT